MISGCYVGTVYVCYGSKQGLKQPTRLLDRKGQLMHLGRLWSEKENKHVSEPGPGERAYSAAPVDWDADGDYDLLIGGDKGGFYLRLNEGTKSAPAFATKPQAIECANGPAKVKGYAMPVLADWDGDGLKDLVSGSKAGGVYWFKNIGKNGQPKFTASRTLLPDVKKGKEPRGERSQVDVVDFDGDGDLDLLVGDLHMHYANNKFDNHGWIWFFERKSPPAPGGN